MKCWQARIGSASGAPGEVIKAGADGIEVACGDGSLIIERLQRPGRTPVTAGEFAAQIDLSGRSLDVR